MAKNTRKIGVRLIMRHPVDAQLQWMTSHGSLSALTAMPDPKRTAEFSGVAIPMCFNWSSTFLNFNFHPYIRTTLLFI